MNTILTDEDEVKFKSFCPKHSGLDGSEYRDSGGEEEVTRDKKRRRGRMRVEEEEEEEDAAASCLPSSITSQVHSRMSGGAEALSSHQQEKRVNLRKLKLEAMEEDFYQFVEVEEVARHLKLSAEAVDFLYQYWKLKRKANFNQPLLTPKKDEEESLARREQEVLRRRLQLFTHLRQDLERVRSPSAAPPAPTPPVSEPHLLLQVRNLTYMVTRREKMKRSLWKVQEQIFQHQIRLLDQELLTGEPQTMSRDLKVRADGAECGPSVPGDPSQKDLEDLFLGSLSSQQPRSRSSCGHSGLRTKQGTLKAEKRKTSDRKSLDSPPPQGKDGSSVALWAKDGRASHNRGSEPDGETKSTTELRLREPEEPEPGPEAVRLCKLESRKGLRKEGPPPEEVGGTKPEEDPRKKRRSEAADGFGFRHLEKSVSIRLVDIRNSDSRSPFRGSAPLPDVAAGNKANAWLRKTAGGGSHGPGRPAAGHLRSWGKFRIPKRGEKTEEQEPLRPLANAPSHPRTRLRTGAEGGGYGPKGGEGEVEPCLKRCHSHQLRGDSSLGRRYGSDIIRRGVLAS